MNLILDEMESTQAINLIVQKIEHRGNRDLCIISILKGGLWTGYRIIEELPTYVKESILIGHIGLSSYGESTESSGEMVLTYPLDLSSNQLKNKNCWIVDDCCDSGETLVFAKNEVKKYCPRNIYTAVLVNKKRSKKLIIPDAVGFEFLKEGFLVGCGMGKGEFFRALSTIHIIE